MRLSPRLVCRTFIQNMHPTPFPPSRWLAAAVLVSVLAAPVVTSAQSDNIAAIVAGMREDIRILDERTRSLTAEIEQLKRENHDLREGAGNANYVSLTQFNAAIAELQKSIRAGDADTALQLTKQLEKHATQVQAALDTLAKGGTGVRTTTPGPTFTPDPNYPKTGITYKVQSGDTLATIAQRNNSTVNWIQSANMISDPRSLQVGQTLFIPQK
jgi:LysM repeat protein